MNASLSRFCRALAAIIVLAVATPQVSADEPHPTPSVTVWSQENLLTEEDQQVLEDQTARVEFPSSVRVVNYLVFASNSSRFNDTVLDHALAVRPELVNQAHTSWAPGHLIVAVGMDPHRNGIYCGDDVCADLDLFEGAHLDASLEAMKPALRRGNLTVGLLDGARAASTPGETSSTSILPYLLVGGVGLAGAGGAVALIRRNQARLARDDYDAIRASYGAIATELDAVDIRANSLTSVFADAELRSQWRRVRDRFLDLDSTLAAIPEHPTAKDFRAHATALHSARTTVDEMTTAQDNIERLYRVEHGDTAARIAELNTLRGDITSALAQAGDTQAEQLQALQDRVDALRAHPDSPSFLDDYALLVHDVATTISAIAEAKFSKVDTRTAPKLTSTDWYPGVGYDGYVPYVVSASRYEAYEASRSSSSSSTDTSYSSSSFSGGGGSSSW
ncbi:DUF5129 domain-containing protein [Corynebacterium sp. 13CS0277]|uniref:DUF5129 domain-containing protein n=1 Tax=Corynebacterium sp. 13CS0277 TaxID=2071994 RepID=UPI000D03A384|nr:DUF5129 domain-containing protein [Corynebacterium sp. 13CS0277]PRQ12102.1 DUF5129 domain-containing protein [Corynebacterium sp. 13CS0277]